MTINLPLVRLNRQCGSCNACCTSMGINSIGKRAGETCRHLNGVCEIYSNRPQECRDFKCHWLIGFLDDGARPDKVGYVFSVETEMGTGKRMMTATEAWPGAFDQEKTLYSLKRLANKIKEPVIMNSPWRMTAKIVLPNHKTVQRLVKEMFKENYEYVQ